MKMIMLCLLSLFLTIPAAAQTPVLLETVNGPEKNTEETDGTDKKTGTDTEQEKEKKEVVAEEEKKDNREKMEKPTPSKNTDAENPVESREDADRTEDGNVVQTSEADTAKKKMSEKTDEKLSKRAVKQGATPSKAVKKPPDKKPAPQGNQLAPETAAKTQKKNIIDTGESTQGTPMEDNTGESDSDRETVLDTETPFGGYGSFSVIGTKLTGSFGAMPGFRGMFVIKKRYAVGVMFSWLQNQTADQDIPERRGFEFGYMTLVGEYIYPVYEFFSVSGEFGMGFGSMKVHTDTKTEQVTIEDKLLVFEPGVTALFSIFDWLHVGAGISYRFVAKHHYEPIPRGEISNLAGKITIRAGRL